MSIQIQHSIKNKKQLKNQQIYSLSLGDGDMLLILKS